MTGVRKSGLVSASSGNSRRTVALLAVPLCTAVEPSPLTGLPREVRLPGIPARSSPRPRPRLTRSPAASRARAAPGARRSQRADPAPRHERQRRVDADRRPTIPGRWRASRRRRWPARSPPAASANGARNCRPGTSDSTPRTAETPLSTVEICGQDVGVVGDPGLDRVPGAGQPAGLLVRRVGHVADRPGRRGGGRRGARRCSRRASAMTASSSAPRPSARDLAELYCERRLASSALPSGARCAGDPVDLGRRRPAAGGAAPPRGTPARPPAAAGSAARSCSPTTSARPSGATARPGPGPAAGP